MFEILANDRKKSIGGSRFEINLKNELKGKAIGVIASTKTNIL